MRTCAIPVRNNQVLEVFVEKRPIGFEVWTVGLVKKIRLILRHSITHDDWEQRLHYLKPNDLTWRDTPESDLPVVKHAVALEQEQQIIKRGCFQDSDNLIYEIANSLNIITTDRKAANIAKKAILGRWTDDVVSIVFTADSKLEFSLPRDEKHPLDMCMRGGRPVPNWWSFASWTLHLMHRSPEYVGGQRTNVVQVDERELHVYSDQADRIAHVFIRA